MQWEYRMLSMKTGGLVGSGQTRDVIAVFKRQK
jgi:hypothetical protein